MTAPQANVARIARLIFLIDVYFIVLIDSLEPGATDVILSFVFTCETVSDLASVAIGKNRRGLDFESRVCQFRRASEAKNGSGKDKV